jgi:hypothetical protein
VLALVQLSTSHGVHMGHFTAFVTDPHAVKRKKQQRKMEDRKKEKRKERKRKRMLPAVATVSGQENCPLTVMREASSSSHTPCATLETR